MMATNERVILEGALNKRSHNFVGIGLWRVRYFRLTPTRFLYTDIKKTKLLGNVPVESILSVKRIAPRRSRGRRFVVRFIDKTTWQLIANTEEECNLWTEALVTVINSMVRVPDNPTDQVSSKSKWRRRIPRLGRKLKAVDDNIGTIHKGHLGLPDTILPTRSHTVPVITPLPDSSNGATPIVDLQEHDILLDCGSEEDIEDRWDGDAEVDWRLPYFEPIRNNLNAENDDDEWENELDDEMLENGYGSAPSSFAVPVSLRNRKYKWMKYNNIDPNTVLWQDSSDMEDSQSHDERSHPRQFPIYDSNYTFPQNEFTNSLNISPPKAPTRQIIHSFGLFLLICFIVLASGYQGKTYHQLSAILAQLTFFH